MKTHWFICILILSLVPFLGGCPKKTPPTSDFTASPTSGLVPLTVQFTDRSEPGSADITSWRWDFGDGAKVTSTQRNPSHAYAVVGSHTVSLTVKTEDGENTKSKPALINVTPGGEGEGEGEARPILA